MQPFTVTCTGCGKSLKVTKPEHIGRTVNCPGCKQKFKIEQPAVEEEGDSAESIAPEAFDKLAASAAPAGFNPEAPSATSSYVRTKKAQAPYMVWGPLGGLAVLIVGFVGYNVWSSINESADQARIYDNLTEAQKAKVDAVKATGEKVRLEEEGPKRIATKPKVEPVVPKAERPPSPLHEELLGRLLTMKRAHKQSLTVAALQQKVDNANYRYRKEEFTFEAYEARLAELTQEIDATEKQLIDTALQNSLMLFQVDAATIAKFAPAYDAAVRAARVPMWKLDDDAKKQVDDAVKKTLADHDLASQKDLVDKMLEFAVEYY